MTYRLKKPRDSGNGDPSNDVAGSLPLTAATLLVSSVERSLAFYRDQVCLDLYRTNDGFACFKTNGAILALWEATHVSRSLGFELSAPPQGSQRIILACELPTMSAVDYHYSVLVGNDVPFLGEPKAYPWNVYAAYFEDPDGYLWEIFAWREGGPAAGGHDEFGPSGG